MSTIQLARATRDNAIASARLLRAYSPSLEAICACVRIARAQNRELIRQLRAA